MNTTSILDVLVVGAGPAGLTLAIDLVRRGVACRIIDRLAGPPVGTRARGISPRSQEIFEDLGILHTLSAYAEPPLAWRLYDRENKVEREMDAASTPSASLPSTPDAPYRSPLQVSQRYTDTALRDRLSTFGLQVEWDSQLIEFKEHADHVVAKIEHAGKENEIIQVRYLVGCDGGHSTVRRRIGIPFEGKTLDDPLSIVANVKVSGLDPNFWHFWMNQPIWGLTLQPMVHEDTWLFSTNVLPDRQEESPDPTCETIQQLFDERTGMPGILFSDLTWFSTFRMSGYMVKHYRNGRVLLAGDAAHIGIAGGQGMNAAIQDVYNLGWKLAHILKGAPEDLLDTYEEERLPVAERFLITSMTHYSAKERLEDGEQAINKMRKIVADLSQLSVAYRDRSLSYDLDAATGIRAGDRAPDAPGLLAENGKEAVRLFDLFQGTHFTLLAFGNQPLPQLLVGYSSILQIYKINNMASTIPLDGHTYNDSAGHAHAAYGVTTDALILIRPDGYVGLTAGSLNTQPIIEYLHRFIT